MKGRKPGLNQRSGTKGRSSHPTRTEEETRIQKTAERVRNLWDNFKHCNIRIIGVPEGGGQEQEVENLFEQIMKENFPSLAKEVDFQEVQKPRKPRESQRNWTQRRTHQGTSSSIT